MDDVSDIVLGEAEQTSLKWAMGMPWFERFTDPASREAAFGDLCIRLEASGVDAEVDDLRERLQALRKYADQVEAERNRLRAVVDAAGAFVEARARWHLEIERDDAPPRPQFQRAYDDTLTALVAHVTQLDGSADMGGTDSTEGAPHESDGDEQTSAHGAPNPPNGGPVPPSTPAPRSDMGEPLLCENCGRSLAEHLRSDGLLSGRPSAGADE